jgi:hypothetical protein
MSGCATIVKGHSQPISVSTTPPGAACQVDRDGETIGTVNPTPGSITVKKSRKEIAVSCTKEGYERADGKVASKFHPMTFGNILFGGIIGIGVDAASGAMNEYEESITVTLIPSEFESAGERDAFFDKMREQLLVESNKTIKDVNKKCTNKADCERRRTAVEKNRDEALAALDAKKTNARINLVKR